MGKDTEEARNVIYGSHLRISGLEKTEMERRQTKYSVPPLGNLTYERQGGTFYSLQHQAGNMSS